MSRADLAPCYPPRRAYFSVALVRAKTVPRNTPVLMRSSSLLVLISTAMFPSSTFGDMAPSTRRGALRRAAPA